MYIESLEICIGMFIATALIRGNTNDKSKLHAMFLSPNPWFGGLIDYT